jgi:hypothetical protein
MWADTPLRAAASATRNGQRRHIGWTLGRDRAYRATKCDVLQHFMHVAVDEFDGWAFDAIGPAGAQCSDG